MRVLLIKTSSMGDVIHTLPALTERTLDLPRLLEQLQACRQNRFATDMGETVVGIGSCSVALDTYLGLFSLSVVAPTARLEGHLDSACTALLKCKQDIERAIGHTLGQT